MISKKTVVTLALILLFLGMIYAPQKYFTYETYAKTLSPYNSDQYGTLDFVKLFNSTGYRVVLGGPDNLDELGEGDVYILMGPDWQLSNEEISRIESFMKRGGSLLIADELGTVNTLTERLFNLRINETYVERFLASSNITTLGMPIIASGKDIIFPGITHLSVMVLPNSTQILEPININQDFYNKTIYLLGLYLDFTYYRAKNYISFHPSLPSYFEDIGILKTAGYIILIDKIDVDSGSYIYKIAPFSAYYEPSEDPLHRYSGRVYIVSDTLIFTNSYVLDEVKEEYSTRQVKQRMDFYINLMYWLSKRDLHDGKTHTLLFDSTHYEPYVVKAPIPHIGRMFLGILTDEIRIWKDMYKERINGIPLWIMPLMITVILISVYTTYRRRIKVKSGDDKWIPPQEERRFVAESPFLHRIKAGVKDKEFYKEMILGLYDLYNYILQETVGRDIMSILREGLPPDVRDKLGDEVSMEIINLNKRISKVREKIIANKFLPIIISWKEVFEKLSYEIDHVCSRLGIEFLEKLEGGKKIEYVIK